MKKHNINYDLLIRKNFKIEVFSLFSFNKLDLLLLYKFYLNNINCKKNGLYLASIIKFLNTNIHYFVFVRESINKLVKLGLFCEEDSKNNYQRRYWLSEKGLVLMKEFFKLEAQLNK